MHTIQRLHSVSAMPCLWLPPVTACRNSNNHLARIPSLMKSSTNPTHLWPKPSNTFFRNIQRILHISDRNAKHLPLICSTILHTSHHNPKNRIPKCSMNPSLLWPKLKKRSLQPILHTSNKTTVFEMFNQSFALLTETRKNRLATCSRILHTCDRN